jgi:hypothetical protein
LTEIYLCNVCSCSEILGRNGRGQVGRVGTFDFMHLVNTMVGCVVFLGAASAAANVITFYLLDDSDLYFEARVDTAKRTTDQRDLAPGERLMISRIFNQVDLDGDGMVTEAEFKEAIETLLGRRMDGYEARNIFRELSVRTSWRDIHISIICMLYVCIDR